MNKKIKNNEIIIKNIIFSIFQYLMQSSRSVKSNSARRDSISSSRAIKKIPRVQIFLDSQLNKAITQIKNQSAIKNPNISSLINKKLSVQQQPVQQSFKPASSIRKQLPPNIATTTKSITLMPYDVVLNYIKQVYEKYGIKNPFDGYLDFENKNSKEKQYFAFQKYPSFSDKKEKQPQKQEMQQSIKTHKKQRKISQNQVKIFQLKNKFKQIIQNQTYQQENTIKKIQQKNIKQPSQQSLSHDVDFIKKSQGNITYIDRLANLMQSQLHDTYDFENDTTLNKTGANEQTPQRSLKHINKFYEDNYNQQISQSPQIIKPKKKLFVKTRATSIKYHSKQDTPQNVKSVRVTFKEFELQPKQSYQQKQIRKQTSIKQIQESSSLFDQNKKYSQYSESNGQIPQIYRYCLGCQEPILNSNIKFHQSKCFYLKQISQLPLNEIYEIVEDKIDRLKQQITKSDLMTLNVNDIQKIKSYTSSFLQNSNQQISLSGKRQNFRKVDDFLQKKLLTGCQLIKKLQWFTKVKENINEKTNISSSSQRQYVGLTQYRSQ